MKVYVEPSADGLARTAARLVAGIVRNTPNAVLALPTGRTPLGMYSELIRIHRDEGLDFSNVRVFNLDEYLGLEPSDPRSFHAYLWSRFLSNINVRAENVRLILAADPDSIRRYEEDIRSV